MNKTEFLSSKSLVFLRRKKIIRKQNLKYSNCIIYFSDQKNVVIHSDGKRRRMLRMMSLQRKTGTALNCAVHTKGPSHTSHHMLSLFF